jgi:hypothetical protein
MVEMKNRWRFMLRCLAVSAACFFVLIFVAEVWTIIFSDRLPRKAINTKCRAMMIGFIMGLKAYQTEYNRFPVEGLTSIDPKAPSITRGKIMTTLHPDQKAAPTESNLRRINFYDPPPAKNKKNGLCMDEHNEPVLVDPWGTPFRFNFDQTGEGKVPNPDPRDNKEHPFVETTVLMYSAGPDGNPDTWEDNILSWK